ncbi:hypothetical protein ONZ51_g8584 [Trametes cubensis]|uniref:Uncharacterized protein n=1 Tax=Trametes cubensis TaxID=1111947 RepID=A0AAD7TQE7_9APHY|nr:hypothetical protein ONZ51_g8584 [Trametes cubensis]
METPLTLASDVHQAQTIANCWVETMHVARANTEIVNFDASQAAELLLTETNEWPVLSPSPEEALLHVQPAPVGTPIASVCEPVSRHESGGCPHETWLAIDLDASPWLSYSKFTLRVSWPAMHPADFFIDVYSPEQLAKHLGHSNAVPNRSGKPTTALTRKKFARIRVVHTGVFTPSPQNANRTVEPVPFIVLVEPLYLGVLPASLVPTLAFLLAVVVVAGTVVLPRVNRVVFTAAEQVKAEIVSARDHKKQ